METVAVEQFVPSFLKKWEYPDHYFGEDLTGWYSVIGRTRDATMLEDSNFECILKALGGESENAIEEKRGVYVAHHSHWAVGWVEGLMIHETHIDLLKQADEIMEGLDGYPVYDDEDYSEREMNAQWELIEQEVRSSLNMISDEWTQEEFDFICWSLAQAQPDFDSCPTHDEIAEAWEETHGHLRHCKIHGDFIDKRPCECQQRMEFKVRVRRHWWQFWIK